jgi:hypothetical protein
MKGFEMAMLMASYAIPEGSDATQHEAYLSGLHAGLVMAACHPEFAALMERGFPEIARAACSSAVDASIPVLIQMRGQ